MLLKQNFEFLKSREYIDLPLFTKLVTILSILASSLIFLSYIVDRDGRERMAAQREIVNLDRYVTFITRRMQDLATDLKVIAQGPALHDYLQVGSERNLANLTRELSALIEAKGIYDQLRYIDETGMEQVRVNFRAGKAEVASHDQLQMKKERYYFTDTMKLDKGQIFVSPFDLNIENKQIEIPYKPTIRLATPIADDQGKRRGIVILNYLGRDLIQRMGETQDSDSGFIELLSRGGDWLRSAKSELEWGFMLGNKNSLGLLYPVAWKNIQHKIKGQKTINGDLWTWSRIYPLSNAMLSSTGSVNPIGKSQVEIRPSDYYWIALNHRPEDLPGAVHRELLARYLGLWLASTCVVVFVGWMVALREGHLKRATEQAQMANKAKTQFLSSMSHELRTPLNAILGFSQLLSLNDDTSRMSETERSNVEEIHKAGKHLLSLIDEILELARIDLGKMTLRIQPISAREITRPCYSMAMSMAQNFDVSIHHQAENDEPPYVMADQTRAKQCLLNFLSNAIKYNHPGGAVFIEYAKTDDGYLRFIVRDTGRGIPKKKQHLLFEAFNRLGQERGKIEGTGIGLVISKEIISRMNGRIGFESEVNKGSTFWMDLPVTSKIEIENESPDTAKALNDRDKSDSQAITSILYIEENRRNIKLMESIINSMGNYSLRTVPTVDLGLEAVSRQMPDLVVININLFDIDDLQVCQDFKRKFSNRDIPIIAISSRHEKQQVIKAGFTRFVKKPINVAKFIELIEEIANK